MTASDRVATPTDRVVATRVTRLPRALTAGVWGLAVGVPLGIVGLALVSPTPEQDAWALPLYSAIVATWGLTGAFLVTRRPDNRVGWVLLAIGVGIGLTILGQMWAGLSLLRFGGLLPGTTAGGILGLLFGPVFFLVMLVPLLFPDGHLMSRRWAAVAAVLLVSALATLVGSIVRPGPLEGMPALDNPLGSPALAGVAQGLIDVGGIGALVCLPAGIVAAILRYRRGTSIERKQLQWFGWVLIVAFSMFILATVLPQPYGQWAWILASISIGLVPVAIAVAILRYRLYEIDRIVSRALAWTVVSGLLVLVFAGAILVLQALLSGITQGDTLAVAASTLIAFALFQPLRRRVQRVVDRRFDRARYDAELTASAFAETLQHVVDLDTVAVELEQTARYAVRPTTASIWLPARGPR